jgi:uncharacterized hydantoinase/oxoprolinase family protein
MDESRARMVRKELFKVIKNQMREGNPPETKETYSRLRAEGHSQKETMKMLASVLLCELNEMVKENRIYNEAAYIKALKALPRLPWEEQNDPS